jgi:hypothetical protein
VGRRKTLPRFDWTASRMTHRGSREELITLIGFYLSLEIEEGPGALLISGRKTSYYGVVMWDGAWPADLLGFIRETSAN